MSKENCECFHGTAVTDASGNCLCVDNTSVNPLLKSVERLPKLPPQPGSVINYYLTSSPNGSTAVKTAQTPPQPTGILDADGKIFGLSPLVVVGIAAAGLWFMSSQTGKEK